MTWLTLMLIWMGLSAALIAWLTLRNAWLARPRRRPDFRDTSDFVLGAEAWCAAHPEFWAQRAAVQTPVPAPGLTLARRRHIDAYARAAAREDFRGYGRRRANPYVRHSREAACWAIAYSDAWTALEIAGKPALQPAHRTGLQQPGAEHA